MPTLIGDSGLGTEQLDLQDVEVLFDEEIAVMVDELVEQLDDFAGRRRSTSAGQPAWTPRPPVPPARIAALRNVQWAGSPIVTSFDDAKTRIWMRED